MDKFLVQNEDGTWTSLTKAEAADASNRGWAITPRP